MFAHYFNMLYVLALLTVQHISHNWHSVTFWVLSVLTFTNMIPFCHSKLAIHFYHVLCYLVGWLVGPLWESLWLIISILSFVRFNCFFIFHQTVAHASNAQPTAIGFPDHGITRLWALQLKPTTLSGLDMNVLYCKKHLLL